jgi:SAM-dependent methyltransferase
VTDPRTALVGAGYDARIDEWESWAAQVVDDARHVWVEALAAVLPTGSRILELGCGGGTRETAALADRFELVGVDLSERQRERARTRVPNATFVHADFTALELEPSSFAAVVSFYAFNHVPRALLAPLLVRIQTWLVRGGRLLAVFGTGDVEAWEGEWVGAPTFFSSFPPEPNRRLVEKAGLRIERDEIVEIAEPEGPAAFQWVLARR